MVSTGIVRALDQLGRVVIPIELRRMLCIEDRSSHEIYVDGSKIILKKYQPACVFCDSFDGIKEFRGMNVCQKCIDGLRPL